MIRPPQGWRIVAPCEGDRDGDRAILDDGQLSDRLTGDEAERARAEGKTIVRRLAPKPPGWSTPAGRHLGPETRRHHESPAGEWIW